VSRADGEGAGLRTHWRIFSGRHAQRSILIAVERGGDVVVGKEGILDEEEEILPNEKVVGQLRTNKEVHKGSQRSQRNEPPANSQPSSGTRTVNEDNYAGSVWCKGREYKLSIYVVARLSSREPAQITRLFPLLPGSREHARTGHATCYSTCG
jgi:hypothetical protein